MKNECQMNSHCPVGVPGGGRGADDVPVAPAPVLAPGFNIPGINKPTVAFPSLFVSDCFLPCGPLESPSSLLLLSGVVRSFDGFLGVSEVPRRCSF